MSNLETALLEENRHLKAEQTRLIEEHHHLKEQNEEFVRQHTRQQATIKALQERIKCMHK